MLLFSKGIDHKNLSLFSKKAGNLIFSFRNHFIVQNKSLFVCYKGNFKKVSLKYWFATLTCPSHRNVNVIRPSSLILPTTKNCHTHYHINSLVCSENIVDKLQNSLKIVSASDVINMSVDEMNNYSSHYSKEIIQDSSMVFKHIEDDLGLGSAHYYPLDLDSFCEKEINCFLIDDKDVFT